MVDNIFHQSLFAVPSSIWREQSNRFEILNVIEHEVDGDMDCRAQTNSESISQISEFVGAT